MTLLQILRQSVLDFIDTSRRLTWLHLSDLHFSHSKTAKGQIILDELLSDIGELTPKIGTPDYIFITGDVASTANPNEYKEANEWISRLLTVLQTPKDRLYIVPGNHDIDRNFTTRISIKTIHDGLRTAPVKLLDEYLSNPEELSVIWPKFNPFSKFASGYGAPKLTLTAPFWAKEQTTTIGNIVIVGLNTILLSFDKDAPLNLALGTTQIQKAIHNQPKDSLLLVLQHHPPDWLSDGSDLKNFLGNRPHILFCGHTHNETGEINYPIHTGGSILFTAGAGYSQGCYSGRYSYSWGKIFSNYIQYYPRIWEDNRKCFDADRNKYPNLDQNGSLFILSSKLPAPLQNWLDKLSPFHNPLFIEGEVTEWIPVFHGELGVLWMQIKCDVATLKDNYKHKAEHITSRLQEVTKDESIKVLMLGEGSVNVILKGTQKGFETIIKFFREGKLSDLLSIPVIDVKTHIQVHVYGATLRTSSIPSPIDITPDTQRDDLMIFPSKPYDPPVFKAVKAFVEDPYATNFVIHMGDMKMVTTAQLERFVDYFCDGLRLKGEEWWVNLSAYESKKMITDNLVNTKAGRDLLAQDCILKRLTASLLHPDTEWGKRYWNRVYAEADQLNGDMFFPFNIYQKVWIVPDSATIVESKLPCESFGGSTLLEKFFCENPNKNEGYGGLIAEARLKVLCETDNLALTEDFGHNENFQDMKSFNDLCTSIFKETILPVIKEEVNRGQNFILLGQIYNALILAEYCKRNLKDYPKWREFIDSGQKLKLNLILENAKDENFKSKNLEKEFRKIEDRLLPNFDLTQEDINNYFYNQYLDLFKKGLYSCTRRHFNPKSQKVFIRTYFSGEIRFTDLRSIEIDRIRHVA